tara:strand:- start:1803 stop:2039 length:237 start_codon:yes stop_codon:yes gene_type:complete
MDYKRNYTKGVVVMSTWFDEKTFSEPPMSFKRYMKRLGKLCNAYDNAKDQEMKTMWSIKMTELYKIYIDSRPRNGTYH